MASESIRVALIGYGLGGRSFHAPIIAANPDLRLSVVVTEHPAARVVANAEDLFERRDDIDVVVISTPNRTHVPLAQAAVDAGLAVVVDKPLAPTSTEARRLIDHAKRRRVF